MELSLVFGCVTRTQAPYNQQASPEAPRCKHNPPLGTSRSKRLCRLVRTTRAQVRAGKAASKACRAPGHAVGSGSGPSSRAGGRRREGSSQNPSPALGQHARAPHGLFGHLKKALLPGFASRRDLPEDAERPAAEFYPSSIRELRERRAAEVRAARDPNRDHNNPNSIRARTGPSRPSSADLAAAAREWASSAVAAGSSFAGGNGQAGGSCKRQGAVPQGRTSQVGARGESAKSDGDFDTEIEAAGENPSSSGAHHFLVSVGHVDWLCASVCLPLL